jgi:hypothetical protein
LDYLRKARESKAQLADELIQHARHVRGATTGKMVRRLIGGGAMTALGGLGLVDAYKRLNQGPLDIFKQRVLGQK